MNFFSFPAEIRLMIYSELLVLDNEAIKLCADHYSAQRLYWQDRGRLHPKILRTNKHVFAEASPQLYAKNRVHFPVSTYGDFNPLIDIFLQYIGARHARLIRHVAIDFPEIPAKFPAFLSEPPSETISSKKPPGLIEGLELLRVSCPSFSTLQLKVHLPFRYYKGGVFSNETNFDEVGDLFTTTLPLVEITVVIKTYDDVPEDRDKPLQLIRNYGWKAKMIPTTWSWSDTLQFPEFWRH
ncbi:hypothetical protein CONLIGDRAFT_630814 [Coniochaeta ligniaria NRRL 30616]|uniref:F-box domain-containing protein n=1 Tax=Coniochaeta ligniaria NRRL 30616 TaxID=1408157 RepID=A0A1J7IUB6_9PEZI|nr:hypothetical protein CONLIGDRAFT_630814 [Coniochaeta ligniaria NRRL 30616]